MNYLDYREALGIGFNDDEKVQIFINRMQVLFNDNHLFFDIQPTPPLMTLYFPFHT